jgi:hypothetical protein
MRKGSRLRVGLYGAMVLIAACGSSGSKGGAGGSGGNGNGRDAAGDQPAGGSGDARMDADTHTDVAGACHQSIATACAAALPGDGGFALHCATSWSVATGDAYFCSRPQTTVLTSTCGDLRELIDTNVNVEYLYFYDASGALVAITYNPGDGSSTCVGGPAAFVAPSACDPLKIFSCTAS